MLTLRDATPEDAPVILDLIRGLAVYERAPDAVVATADALRQDAEHDLFHCVLADWNGSSAGFAFYFFHYSTWLARPGLYLEDLFVRPEFRGKGIGKALLRHLAQVAVEKDCYAMRWQVLDWNQPAIDFYERLGAKVMREWLDVRISGESLRRLGE